MLALLKCIFELYSKLRTLLKNYPYTLFRLIFFSRYDKFRKSDKKLKIDGTEENDTNVADNVNEKNDIEVKSSA